MRADGHQELNQIISFSHKKVLFFDGFLKKRSQKTSKNVCFIRNTGRLCHFQGNLYYIYTTELNCGYVDTRALQNMCGVSFFIKLCRIFQELIRMCSVFFAVIGRKKVGVCRQFVFGV